MNKKILITVFTLLSCLLTFSQRPDVKKITISGKVIEKGTNQPEYFAARAALQIGLIYEQKGNLSLAITFFNTCLEMKNHAFKNSLDQKAKTGIQRCLRK